MANYVQANTNGRLHDATEASVSPLDRGFLYGDAIYEVWRTYERVVFAFDEHWRRLLGSAAALGMPPPFSRDELFGQIARTCGAFREKTGSEGALYIRLQATRGGGGIGLDPRLAESPLWVILVQDLAAKTAARGTTGLELSISRNFRRNPIQSLNPAWKTGNYLNNLICLDEVRARGADEVLILNESGAICEASVCNVFFVRGQELVTPPLTAGILAGVTRALIVAHIASGANLTAIEADVWPNDLDSFDECFLSSSTRDVIPVSSIDEHAYATGEGTVSQRLKNAFARFASDYALNHPELRV
jgi:branched-chain amino acid aminotransferase